ncbi:MAG: AAA family ATPase, partial [Spirochaetaceae bacterium]|nr:AAA family ATPase [Spirochaetaceae bacterium]
MKKKNLDNLTPQEIVRELDKYIIGQEKAKRAVAVALRNRIRRLKLDPEIREDIAPKNILMIGPTGVGKTEIARRLAKLAGSPFLKVEATKYTEVGYVGRDVESMVRDLMASGYQMVKQEMQESVKADADKRAEEALLDLLLPGSGGKKRRDKSEANVKPVITPVGSFSINNDSNGPSVMGTAIQVGIPIVRKKTRNKDAQEQAEREPTEDEKRAAAAEKVILDGTREKFRAMLREGKFEDKTVELSVSQEIPMPSFGMMGSGMEEIESSLSGIAGLFGSNKKRKVLSVKRAREILINEEAEKLIDTDRVTEEARRRVQEMGIIF